jgi:hypothetical protein
MAFWTVLDKEVLAEVAIRTPVNQIERHAAHTNCFDISLEADSNIYLHFSKIREIRGHHAR